MGKSFAFRGVIFCSVRGRGRLVRDDSEGDKESAEFSRGQGSLMKNKGDGWRSWMKESGDKRNSNKTPSVSV